jgi:WASH complex subunit strumpellin
VKVETLDDVPFLVGVITLLKQFHSNITTSFFAYIGQYIRCTVASFVEKYVINILSHQYPMSSISYLINMSSISCAINIS